MVFVREKLCGYGHVLFLFPGRFMLATMLIFPETTLVVVVVVGQHTKKNPPQFIKVQELMDVNGTQKESLQMGFNNRGWHFIHIFSSQCHWGQDDRSWHLAY